MHCRHISIANASNIEFTESSATGIPVVALHGIGSGAESFDPCAELLPNNFRLVAWNAPGYGASTAFTRPDPTVGDYADAVLALVDALNFSRVHLVGHSLGGLIGLNVLARYPERLLSATLCSVPIGDLHSPPDIRWRNLALREHDLLVLGPEGLAAKRSGNVAGHGSPASVHERVRSVMAKVNSTGYAQAAWMLAHGDALGDAQHASTDIPCSFLVGEYDVITPPSMVSQIADQLPKARYREVKGLGHAFYVADPQSLIDEVTLNVTAGQSRI